MQAGTIGVILTGTSVALTKSGTGTAILTAANTYGGATTINGGTLQLGNGSTTGVVAGNIAINAAGTFDFNRSDAVTYSGKISGDGTLSKSGGGTLIMSGTNSFSGNLAGQRRPAELRRQYQLARRQLQRQRRHARHRRASTRRSAPSKSAAAR